jgi:hypothetical protein
VFSSPLVDLCRTLDSQPEDARAFFGDPRLELELSGLLVSENSHNAKKPKNRGTHSVQGPSA